MKISLISRVCCMVFSLIGSGFVFAGDYPQGEITIHNATNKNITAEVSSSGKFKLTPNAQKSVSYSTLAQVCSPNPTQCRAQFYVNDAPVGSAVINVKTGKLMSVNIPMKVRTVKEQQVLRSVVIA